MSFFHIGDETDAIEMDEAKVKLVPSNLGCESEFAKLDVCVTASGGSTSIQTHFHKNINLISCWLIHHSQKSKQYKNNNDGNGHEHMLRK